jgi:sugar phosphate isomerase/epimerase
MTTHHLQALCSVGYTYRDHAASVAFAQALRQGYSHVELRDYRGSDWSTPAAVRTTVASLAAQARLLGLEPWAVFQTIDLPNPADIEDALDRSAGFIATLRTERIPVWHARLHVPGVPNSRVASAAVYAASSSFLSRLGAQASTAGITIAIESHMGTIHDTAASQWRLIDACRTTGVAASLDFANLRIENAAEDLDEAIRRFSGRIGYVHLKNIVRRNGGWDWDSPIRDGEIDYGRVLRTLAEHYHGPLGVEYCGPGDPVRVAEDDAAYLRELLRELASAAPSHPAEPPSRALSARRAAH